jgi:hypothetical protein
MRGGCGGTCSCRSCRAGAAESDPFDDGDAFAEADLALDFALSGGALAPVACDKKKTESCIAIDALGLVLDVFPTRLEALDFLRQQAGLPAARVALTPIKASLCPAKTVPPGPGPDSFKVVEKNTGRNLGSVSRCRCCDGGHLGERWVAG